jgi:hypothetical protein
MPWIMQAQLILFFVMNRSLNKKISLSTQRTALKVRLLHNIHKLSTTKHRGESL